MLYFVVIILVFFDAAKSVPTCPNSCQCSSNPEDFFSITCPGVSGLLLPNETLQVDCLNDYDLSNSPQDFPSAPEVSLTNCPPQTFASSEVKTLLLRNVSSKSRIGEWTGLQKLDISNNKLGILSSRFLNGLQQGLVQLDLSKCQLHFLYPSCFRGFSPLKELYLEDNDLAEIDDDQFKDLENLWLLHLWGNKVSKLSNDSFAGLSQLRHLDLSHNRLTSVHPAVLAHLPQLEHLDLSGNKFISLPADFLRRNSLLEVFKFEQNTAQSVLEPEAEWLQSIELPHGMLADLPRLSRVSFAHSAVATVPRFLLRGSRNLTHLDLRGNRLTLIPKFFLQDAGKLKWLDLSHNNLQTFSDDLFLVTTSVQYLNMSSNLLEELPPGEVYKNVQILDITFNQLERFSRSIQRQIVSSSELKELFFVRGNKWDCQNRYTKELFKYVANTSTIATDFANICFD